MGEEGVMRRLKLDYDGNLRLYSLDDATGSWRATWATLPRQCDVHGVCTRYGVCVYQPLLGAGPALSCSESFDFWVFDFNYTPGVSMETCRKMCLDDCNCECYPKITLWNGRAPDISKQNIFLKVATRLKAKDLNPTVLDFHGHAFAVQERNASVVVGSSYFHVRGNRIKFAYFYSFLAVIFVVEAIFIVASGLATASRRVHSEERVRAAVQPFQEVHLRPAVGRDRQVLREARKGRIGDRVQGCAGRRPQHRGVPVGAERDERINHMNLVRMWGFCSEHSNRLLVSEFVENGTLDNALFVSDGGESTLGWRSRCKIAAGVAKGLAHLHHECLEWIVHCDMKPENIL
ncbi:hypothetical protein BDA96_06G269500, partial [Sorghum bicolor]